MTYLCHNHVLHRNICIANSSDARRAACPFTVSTSGLHYVGLVNAVNGLWNSILELGKGCRAGDLLVAAPLLQVVLSDESFRLVFSPSATAAFASATAIKTEDLQPSVDLSDDEDEGVLDEELQQG